MRRRIYGAAVPNGSVVGLDLSLRASAAAAVAFNWDQKLVSVKTRTFGCELEDASSQRERIQRMVNIADGVLAFCKETQARAVYVEDHAFGMGGRSANQTIEMTGIVKARLFDDWGVVVVPVASASARKTLLQHLVRSDVKKWVVKNVRRLGKESLHWSDDEIDAFVIMNHGLMVQGGTAMTFLGV